MKLELTKSRLIKSTGSMIWTTAFVVIAMFLAGMAYGFDEGLYLIFSVGWAVSVLPALYLHVRYYRQNRYEIYELSDKGLMVNKAGEAIHYTREDIQHIDIYMSQSVYQHSSWRQLVIEDYHFARIRMKNGERYIISCLFTPKVEEAISELHVPYNRHTGLFNDLDKGE